MEIGVVVHGPGIVDSGWAEKIIDILSNFGNVSCRLGGTMGRTAVIDAGLEDVIDISLKLLPSQSLELFNREHADVIFLLNYGKSPETGRVFGYKVFTHYFKQISNEDFLATNHKPLYESSIPVIQIERPGEEDGAIISWNVVLNEQLAKSKKSKRARLGLGDKNMLESLSFSFEELFDGLKAALDLIEVTPEEVVSDYFSNNQESEDEKSIENLLQSYDDYETSHYTYRKIHGVSPDENIFINGIVVGYSNADSIVLIARDGMIVDIINGTIKYHGLEKLGPVDLERIIVNLKWLMWIMPLMTFINSRTLTWLLQLVMTLHWSLLTFCTDSISQSLVSLMEIWIRLLKTVLSMKNQYSLKSLPVLMILSANTSMRKYSCQRTLLKCLLMRKPIL